MTNAARRWLLATISCALLLAPGAASAAQGSCDVEVTLDDPSFVPFVAFGLDYSGIDGEFVGNSTQNGAGGIWDGPRIACSNVATEMFDGIDDKAGTLSLFFADTQGVSGPLVLTTCVFEYFSGAGCPAPGDFAIVEQAFPENPMFPEVPITFPPPPDARVSSVTPRVAVCGDGFREAPEQCDDGNTDDGDCCASDCALDPLGTPCPDADVCTLGEACDGAGRCVIGSQQQCDDGVFCTADFCDPVAGCQTAAAPTRGLGSCGVIGKSGFDLRDDATSDARDRLVLRGRTSFSSPPAGDPTDDTNYAICIWDTQGDVPSLASKIEIPAGSGWKALSAAGSFRYVDPSGGNGGIQKLLIRTNKKGDTKFVVRGSGANLPLPGPTGAGGYFSQDPKVVVEIENDRAGGCWADEFYPGVQTRRNQSDRFKGRTKF